MSLHVRVLAAGVLVASGLALAACGGQPAASPQVPTLPSSGSTTSGSGSTASGSGAAATSADPGQPRERLDMTNDELAALAAPYNQCLIAHGDTSRKIASGQAVGPGMVSADVAAKAEAACKSLAPLPPWELDANNPHGADFVHAVVQCLRAKGVKYVDEEPPQDGRYVFGFGGANNDQQSITLGLRYAQTCENQVAAQGIGR
jgi:hypothetical protein